MEAVIIAVIMFGIAVKRRDWDYMIVFAILVFLSLLKVMVSPW